MFTGIIQEIGQIEKISKINTLTKIAISSKIIFEEATVSDSISVNGVCLTLTDKKNNILYFDVVKSTVEKTNLKRIKSRDAVNLEQALKMGDKLGGHFVLGHIDCETRIKRIIKKVSYYTLEIDMPTAFRRFIAENGSIALNGISLTVKSVKANSFSADIIPFTYENTNLKYKRIGDWLNIEFDYLLKKNA